MLIGAISDTHDNLTQIKKAVDFLIIKRSILFFMQGILLPHLL